METFLTKDLEKYDDMYTYFINPNQVELDSDKGNLKLVEPLETASPVMESELNKIFDEINGR